MKNIAIPLQIAASEQRRAVRSVTEKFDKWRVEFALSRKSHKFVDRITTDELAGADIRLSTLAAAVPTTKAMVTALLEHHEKYADRKHHKYWFVTICLDIGITDAAQVSCDLTQLDRKIDKLLRRNDLQGTYKLEPVQLLSREAGDVTRVLFHAHAMCWRSEKGVQPRTLAKSMMKSETMANSFGPAVVFKACKMTPEDIAYLGYYMTKVPACVETLRPRYGKPGQFLMTKSGKDFTPSLVAQMMEILSFMPLYKVVRGVGKEGNAVRRAWKARMKRWERKLRNPATLSDKKTIVDGWYKVHIERSDADWRAPQIVV